MDVEKKIAIYEKIRVIIAEAEDKIVNKYKECIDNSWMDEYTDFSIETKLEALKDILELTKD